MIKRNGIATIHQVEVSRDISGGVKLRLGAGSFVLSPADAVKYAAAVLQCAGVNVEFSNPGQSIVRPPAGLSS